MPVDEEKLMGYVHQAVGDFGAILCAALINIGRPACAHHAPCGHHVLPAARPPSSLRRAYPARRGKKGGRAGPRQN